MDPNTVTQIWLDLATNAPFVGFLLYQYWDQRKTNKEQRDEMREIRTEAKDQERDSREIRARDQRPQRRSRSACRRVLRSNRLARKRAKETLCYLGTAQRTDS